MWKCLFMKMLVFQLKFYSFSVLKRHGSVLQRLGTSRMRLRQSSPRFEASWIRFWLSQIGMRSKPLRTNFLQVSEPRPWGGVGEGSPEGRGWGSAWQHAHSTRPEARGLGGLSLIKLTIQVTIKHRVWHCVRLCSASLFGNH